IAPIVLFRILAKASFCELRLPATLAFLVATVCFSPVLKAQSEATPEDARVQKLYGEAKAAEAHGDLAGAAASYESLLQIALRANPKDNNAELFLANDLIKLGKFQRAAEHLRQLSQRQPENQEVWYLLGKVHMKLSEEALSKLNGLDPNSVWVHEISGEVMESMKNYDGALLEYKKAVEVAPQQAGTHYHLGNAYWALNMWDAATEQF